MTTAIDPFVWWQPHEDTRRQGDHPIRLTAPTGEITWAIPPNKEGNSVELTLPNGAKTWDSFATLHWDYGVLAPGGWADKPLRFHDNDRRRPIQEGDLVFDTPNDAASHIIGVAIMDRRRDPADIIAFRPYNEWPAAQADLNSF